MSGEVRGSKMPHVCEVCSQELIGPTLDLGSHPLCDDLQRLDSHVIAPPYEQIIQLCSTCLTAHQLNPVEKEKLFKPDYHYRAGLTTDVLNGMEDLVSMILDLEHDRKSRIVLDVGCNDGSLLGIFKKRFPEIITIGVDPTNAIKESGSKIDYPIQSFFNENTANQILEKFGRPDIITFTNVFAHIENLPQLLSAIKILVSEKTTLVIENHYLGAILEKNQFDTFYHEHPRTYSAHSFQHIAQSLGMSIKSIELPKRYGGNIRVVMVKTKIQESAAFLGELKLESNFLERFERMQTVFENWKLDSMAVIGDLAKGGEIYGKSLPGRAVMLISSLGLDNDFMPAVFEQNKSPKVGHYVPGTKIKILSDDELLELKPRKVIVWGWHIADEVCEYLKQIGFRGEIWVPLPSFRLYKIV